MLIRLLPSILLCHGNPASLDESNMLSYLSKKESANVESSQLFVDCVLRRNFKRIQRLHTLALRIVMTHRMIKWRWDYSALIFRDYILVHSALFFFPFCFTFHMAISFCFVAKANKFWFSRMLYNFISFYPPHICIFMWLVLFIGPKQTFCVLC